MKVENEINEAMHEKIEDAYEYIWEFYGEFIPYMEDGVEFPKDLESDLNDLRDLVLNLTYICNELLEGRDKKIADAQARNDQMLGNKESEFKTSGKVVEMKRAKDKANLKQVKRHGSGNKR